MTPIEIIAAIFAIVGLIKIIVILINKKNWLPVTKAVYGNSGTSSIIFFILAIIVFYYLIQAFTIVEIVAVVAFISLIMGLAFLQTSKDVLSMANKALNKKFTGWMWIIIIIWLILLVWTLYTLFF